MTEEWPGHCETRRMREIILLDKTFANECTRVLFVRSRFLETSKQIV